MCKLCVVFYISDLEEVEFWGCFWRTHVWEDCSNGQTSYEDVEYNPCGKLWLLKTKDSGHRLRAHLCVSQVCLCSPLPLEKHVHVLSVNLDHAVVKKLWVLM